MEKILVSACLAGVNCKYNGKNNLTPILEKLKEKYEFIYICPEHDGGLPIPRDPSERIGNKVISNKGKDVTEEYTKGASIALALALKNDCKIAILKDGSPSCGNTYIYDGTFHHNKIKGKGVTAEVLTQNGIKIYTENEIEELL